ncbi:hypothetical protein [Paenibacillus sp. FSL H7-0714]|uniref:hypothetical protein n=1 Tax=Paenibacillus sp. FSL H7-0714 TaxID=2954735 RepID=UPI0030FBAAFA
MLYAVKGNKQLQIDDAERDTYLKLGYDIATQEGDRLEVVENAPSKTVPYKDHEVVVRENVELKRQVAASGTGSAEAQAALKKQLEDARKEIESLKAQLADTKKTAKADK